MNDRTPTEKSTPLYSLRRLRRQLRVDSALWWLYKFVLCLAMCYAVVDVFMNKRPEIGLGLFLIVFLAGWTLYGLTSARVAQQLPQITEWIETDPGTAETALASSLRRRPLQRSLRLLLYHRVAMVYRRRERFSDVAEICQALLSLANDRLAAVRGHLLILLTESCLQCGDLVGTWWGLTQLHACRLTLIEKLQLVALQTRYEVQAGHNAVALHGLEQKLTLIELMPAPQCGAIHATLAKAAQRVDQNETAHWLRRRAELLCTPEQLENLGGTPTHHQPV